VTAAAPFVAGQAVQIECCGQTLAGEVIFSSSNGKSLMLGFDAMLEGHIGMMPVLQDDDGAFHSVMNGVAVRIMPAQ
jgi:hypothetical protein